MPRTDNLRCLQIHIDQLLALENSCLSSNNSLRYLDVCPNQDNFDERVMMIIAKLFANIEHLAINTRNLENIPTATHLFTSSA